MMFGSLVNLFNCILLVFQNRCASYREKTKTHHINQEKVLGIVNGFVNFFEQIQNLLEIAYDATTIMQDWAETMQDQVENVFNCEYSVLLGFDIGIHLPQPIGSAELGR